MFVDANVLVYARVLESPLNLPARQALEQAELSSEPLRTSRQVLREYLATMTRPQSWENPLTRHQVLDDIQTLSQRLEMLEDGDIITRNLVTLCRDIPVGGKQIHDANIVATMLAYGERQLLTFNTSDFRRYEDRIELVGA